jgi:hypothetical protein
VSLLEPARLLNCPNAPGDPAHVRTKREDSKGWNCAGCKRGWYLLRTATREREPGALHRWSKRSDGVDCLDCEVVRRMVWTEQKPHLEYLVRGEWTETEPECDV